MYIECPPCDETVMVSVSDGRVWLDDRAGSMLLAQPLPDGMAAGVPGTPRRTVYSATR